MLDRQKARERERANERGREKDFVVTKRLAIRRRRRRTYYFVVDRCYTYDTGKEVQMNIYVRYGREEKRSKREREKKPNKPY